MAKQGESYIEFTLQVRPHDRKTDVWRVTPAVMKGVGIPVVLGEVRFFSQWRKYCFFPHDNTVLDTVCLQEIAGFCDMKTLLWRKEWKNGRTDRD